MSTLGSFCGNARRTRKKAFFGTFVGFIRHLGSTADTRVRMRWAKHHKMADFMEEEKKVQYFPEGSLLNTMIISIIDSEKRFTDILKEPYTVYLIETK